MAMFAIKARLQRLQAELAVKDGIAGVAVEAGLRSLLGQWGADRFFECLRFEIFVASGDREVRRAGDNS